MRLAISILVAIAATVTHVHAGQCRPKQPSSDKIPDTSSTVIPVNDGPSSSHSKVSTVSSSSTLQGSVAPSSASPSTNAEPSTTTSVRTRCATTVDVTTCSTKPTTSYVTVPKTCTTVITETITSTSQPITTITTTKLLTSTVTDTRSNQIQTSTSTSSVVTTTTLRNIVTATTTVTSTLQTVSIATPPAAFTPVRSSLPGGSTVNQKRRKRSNFSSYFGRAADSSNQSDVDLNQMRHDGDVKCYVSTGACSTKTVTSTVAVTASASTSTFTTTSTVLVVRAPSATSTTTVVTTETNISTVTAAPSTSTVSVTTTTTQFTSTTYPACDPTNVINRVNGEAIVYFRQNDTSAVITTNRGRNSSYDCCVSSLQVADSALWIWNSQSNDCFHVGIPSCKAPQADNDQMTLVIRPNGFGYTVGNAYCGQWGFAVEA